MNVLIPVPHGFNQTSVFKVEDTTSLKHVMEALWNPDLPEAMNLYCRGNVFVFKTRQERMHFAHGLELATISIKPVSPVVMNNYHAAPF